MNRRPSDIDPRLAAWLEEGPSTGPEEVLSRTFARARSTRQDRVWLHRLTQPTRFLAMNSMLKVAVVAVFALAVGAIVLPRGPEIASAPVASPSPSPSAVPFPQEPGHLEPGRYSGPLYSGQVGTERWAVTVPEGWEQFFDVLWSDLGTPGTYLDVGGPGEVAFGWWEVADVFADPCHWMDSLAEPSVGPRVDDLVTAFLGQVGRHASGPTNVVLGGLPAKRVELTVPADLDLTSCDEGAYREFLAPGEEMTLTGQEQPSNPRIGGRVDVYYILDIAGSRFLLRTWHLPDASEEDLAELEAMVDSIRIDVGPPAPTPAASLAPPSLRSPGPEGVTNGWIAFSSQPHVGQVMPTDGRQGGDIYLAHDSDDLRMLVSRGPGMDTNVCPALSPDGTRLAYGERTDAGIAIVILDLAPDGSIVDTSRLPLDTADAIAPCPRWSADGARIGSLEGRNVVVVRGLDGSIVQASRGDPTYADFVYSDTGPLDSPSGELSVRSQGDEIVVHPLDGSPDRTIAREFYAIWGWSPDSTKVLLKRDASAFSFTLWAASIDEPFTLEVIAEDIPTNGGRSWPSRRDLSWQAVHE
jgi:hypothetical protein